MGMNTYACVCPQGEVSVCAIDPAAALIQCGPECEVIGGPLTCEGDTPDTDGPSYDPAGFVWYDSLAGEYVVNGGSVDQLKAHPRMLQQDAAMLTAIYNGSGVQTDFKFQNVQNGSLAWLLGFRNNERPRKVNGRNVRTWSDFLIAWELFYDDTYFVVDVYRPSTGTTVVRRYRVEYPSLQFPSGG
jgi:hypothetical protein